MVALGALPVPNPNMLALPDVVVGVPKPPNVEDGVNENTVLDVVAGGAGAPGLKLNAELLPADVLAVPNKNPDVGAVVVVVAAVVAEACCPNPKPVELAVVVAVCPNENPPPGAAAGVPNGNP